VSRDEPGGDVEAVPAGGNGDDRQFQCPRCGRITDTTRHRAGQPLVCQHCYTRLKTPGGFSLEPALPAALPPNALLQPIVLQVPVSGESEEYVREKTTDLRERRTDRTDDRAANPLGIIGFAVCLTTLLFLLSGFAVKGDIPFYL